VNVIAGKEIRKRPAGRTIRVVRSVHSVTPHEETQAPVTDRIHDDSVSSPSIPVTILIPTKNNPRQHLIECWKSVLDQDHVRWEAVFVDDSDRKETLDTLRWIESSRRARVIWGDGRGLSAALNKGIADSRTELIARMDADDVMVKDRIRVQVLRFSEDPNLDVLGGQIEGFGACNPYTSDHPPIVTLQHMAKSRWGINHPTAMFRKSSVDECGGYCEAVVGAEDFDLWVRMLLHGMTIRNESRVTVRLRHHQGNESKTHCKQMMESVNRTLLNIPSVRPRVAFVCSRIGHGGAERWLVDLVNATSARYEWVICANLSGHNDFVRRLSEASEVIIGEEAKQAPKHCDCVLYWWTDSKIQDFVYDGQRVMFVNHTQNGDPFLLDWQSRIDSSYVTLPIGVSKSSVEGLRSIGYRNAICIPPGIKTSFSKGIVDRIDWLHERRIPQEVRTYGFLARLTPDKGFPEMRQFAGTLKDEYILAAGDLELEDAANIPTTVRLLDFVRDTQSFLGACDALIVPSRFESFCYAIVESWAVGTPVLSTPVGVAEDNPGWVIGISPRDHVGIRNAVEMLERSSIDTESVSRMALERYSWKNFRESWNDILWRMTSS
jgi:glycosyltransferase involved in cell wall biosynthesis